MFHPKSWHIELTSRCVLECPGCDRTWFKKTFGNQIIQDVNPTHLTNFFQRNNFLQSHLTLCGNNGDPIYHPDFIELLKSLKKQKHSIDIHTNGSAKNTTFWHNVGKQTDANDRVIFAIDGLENTNHLYRKNSNWKQVVDGVNILKNYPIKLSWQFIAFDYNIDQIDTAKVVSKQLGFDDFFVKKSDRWMDEMTHQYKPKKEQFINKKLFDHKSQLNAIQMKPQCLDNKSIFIDSDGSIYPCCYTASYRFKFKTDFGKNPANIQTADWKNIFTKAKSSFLESTKNTDTAHLVCKMHCG